MAKCGCNPSCSCRIEGNSPCLKVSGIGTPSNPYQADVIVDGTSITCDATGLHRVINTLDTNTVDISGNGTAANPLKMDVILTPNAGVPDPDGLGTGNLIKELPGPGGGIYVGCEDVQDCVGAALADLLVGDCLVYDDVANAMTLQICSGPNGVQCVPAGDPTCPAGGLAVIPSSDPNNALTIGTDGRLYSPAFSITAGPCLAPLTQAGTPADPFILTPQVAPEPNGLECIPGAGLAVIPSSDPNNGLTFGADNRLFSNICFKTAPTQIHVGENGPCIETIGNGCDVPFQVILRLSDDPCQGICCRADGLFVFSNPTPSPNAQIPFSENWQNQGPFNGTFNDMVLMAPRCATLTNPSNCKTLLGSIVFSGTVDLQKNAGNFVLKFETSLTGPGGPWKTSVSAAALDPDPPTPQPVRLISTLDGPDNQAFQVPPGGSQQVCVRITVDGFFLNTGRINNSDRTFQMFSNWGQTVNACPQEQQMTKNLSVFFTGTKHISGPFATCEDAAQDAIDNGPPNTYIARQNDPAAACAESASE